MEKVDTQHLLDLILTHVLHWLKLYQTSLSLDNGTKYMPPSNLEFTKINVDNLSENVVPQSASAKFNVRFNSKYKSSSLKKVK